MITVLGATGQVGGKIANTLLDQGIPVRAVARNVERLRALAERGAELCLGDISDARFVAEVLSGVDAAFTLIPPNPRADSFLRYAHGIADALAEGVKKTRVPYVVNLSSMGAELSSGTGPIQGLHYSEVRLNAISGVHILHLRPAYFMENLLSNIPLIRSRGIMAGPIQARVTIPMIATRDIAEVAARHLAAEDFEGARVLLGPEDLSMNDVAEIVSRLLDRKIPYVMLDRRAARQALIEAGLALDVADGLIEMSEALNQGRISAAGLRSPETVCQTRFEDFAVIFREQLAGAARVA